MHIKLVVVKHSWKGPWMHVVLILSTLSSNTRIYNCSCRDESWAVEHKVSSSTTAFHDYLISIYWAAATTTTVGYGDISAHTILVT